MNAVVRTEDLRGVLTANRRLISTARKLNEIAAKTEDAQVAAALDASVDEIIAILNEYVARVQSANLEPANS